ncbi:MAG TPA: FGGY family carbohydrate kinase [Capsulimonadaceae bacterium]
MKPTLLAFDLGTTGNKAVLIDAETGHVLRSAFAPYESFYSADGGAEQNPADWWKSVAKCCSAMRDEDPMALYNVAAVGCTGTMNGAVLIDAHGHVIRKAIIHADTRATDQCDRLVAELGLGRIYYLTQNRLDPHVTIPKLMWLAENDPRSYGKADWVIQCKDYIAGKLTGEYGFTDHSDASLTGGYNVHRRRWAHEIWEAAGIRRNLLPVPRNSTDVIGMVTREAARLTGIPQGVPVVAGGGDGACASAGSGTPTGEVYNYLGGTSWIGRILAEPIIDMRLSSYCCLDDRVTTYGTVQAAGTSIEWVAKLFSDAPPDFIELDRIAAESPVGSKGLEFLPYLQGERAPLWDPYARGVLTGLDLRHKRPDMYRAVLEGVTFALKSILDVFEANGDASQHLRVMGGGAQSALWRSLIASVTGRTVRVVADQASATAIGAAMAAGVGAGVYSSIAAAAGIMISVESETAPDPTDAAAYPAHFERWMKLYPALEERFVTAARV